MSNDAENTLSSNTHTHTVPETFHSSHVTEHRDMIHSEIVSHRYHKNIKLHMRTHTRSRILLLNPNSEYKKMKGFECKNHKALLQFPFSNL